jgi:hypothetical protein
MKFNILLLVFLLSQNFLSSQNLFEIKLNISDSSKTVFGYNKFVLQSNTIPYDEDTSIPNYTVELLYWEEFYMQLRPDSNSNWLNIEYCNVGGNADSKRMYINTDYYNYNFINFTKMFLDSTLNFEVFKNGKTVEFRFIYRYKINDGVEQLAYSNIEKVYFPPYSVQDSLGLSYIRPFKKDVDCRSLALQNEDVINLILQNCQGSVLAEQAFLRQSEIRLSDAFQTRDEPTIILEREYYLNVLRQLSLTSQSDFLRINSR